MSLRYRDQNGNTTIIAGLTPGGDIEAGAVAQRTGLIEFNEDTPTGVKLVEVTFDSPMPDADYDVQLSLYSNIPSEFGLCSIDYWNDSTHKTANGFVFLFYNGTGSTITNRMKFRYTAIKTYTVQHAAETATAVNTIQAAMPSGASSANKLTTASQLSAVENALDARLDSLEDIVPVGTSISNQLINKSELDTAIANVEIDVDDEISSTSENPVENKVIYDALGKKQNLIFKGTTAEWNALSVVEKAKYDLVTLTDDSSTGDVVDAVTDGVMKPVTSNAVADAITAVQFNGRRITNTGVTISTDISTYTPICDYSEFTGNYIGLLFGFASARVPFDIPKLMFNTSSGVSTRFYLYINNQCNGTLFIRRNASNQLEAVFNNQGTSTTTACIIWAYTHN